MEDLQNKIIELMDLFDGEVTTADKIPQPAPRQDVVEIDAVNEFMKRNPMAGGGMLVQPSADGSRPGYAKDKKKINRDESYRKVVKDFTATSGPGTGKIFDDPAAIEIVKANLNKIKKQRNNKALFEWSEDSDWYRKLRKELNPNTKTGTNREYTNKLINQVVDEFFSGAYNGKNAIKNFRNDMVVKSFIQHLKSVGEFDGQEKFDPVLEQFKNPPKKGTPNNYESINKSWKQWIAGEFEVDGVDRAQLKKELKARGINYDETIGKWTASGAQLRGKDKIKELKTLNKFNKFTNKSVDEIKALFLKEHPNANFDLRVNELTQLKRNGVYISGATTERFIPTINKGDRAGWLKNAYGKQFAGNYSKIINAADKLNDPNFEGGKFYDPKKAERLYKAADKFFGPTGIVRKSAVGEAEHALARSFDFLNPDRQLAINSIVDGDLNQFKKNLFDIPVKNYFNEYNNPNTTKARRVELKNLIEERKKVMNALTGGQKSGIVAGDIVNFRYGPNEITATSNVKPIDTLFKQGKFNIDDYIERGNKYTESFQTAARELNILDQSGKLTSDVSTPIKAGSPLYKKLMKFCPKNNGGQAGVCSIDEAMKGLVSESKQLQSGNMNDAQAKKTAQKIRAVTRVGTGSTLMGLLGPYGVAGEVVIDGAFMANNMLDGGDTYKEALSKSLIKYAMPKDARERLEKETDLNTMILGSDTKGLAANYADALKKDEDLKQKYENYLKVNQDDVSSLDDPYSSGSAPMFSLADKNKAERELIQAMTRAEPTYGKSIYEIAKFGSPEQQAFATKQEVFDAEKMQRRMDYDRKILGPIKDLFDTGFYSPAQLKQLELKADRDTELIGQMSEEDKMQRIANYGGVANLAKGGRAGFASGTGGYDKPSHRQYLKDIESDLHRSFKRYKRIYGGKMKFNQYAPKFLKENLADGGIAGLSGGDPEGAMLESMNPDSQGLQGLFNRVKKV